ncbi:MULTISPECIES: Ger(x)C family spore germination protein [Geobacillus]|uniref:Ger(X)C family spore germination protein n=2 Tax=Geobacillus TaxID=129337 RepID=A0A1Q5T567_9BACL|nr:MULTISPECIES: Ger(x)C family spore germination protein [Geobacillus]AGE22164.1 spore germination protein [Geobacillus sp. GHH01]OKO95370.1 hypothetical protein BRO54_1011 [Geobacillus proteiniphilus]OQP15578.1 spore gernimation protein GerC [Geobacillus zalihae]WMJ15338.1 Ger(x)C family spore germination protein [Geobacillus proteiniphilus]
MIKRLFALLFAVVLLSGCWGVRNIDHLLYIHSIGIDYKDGKMVLYVQLINFSGLAKVEAGGTREQATVSVGKATGETFDLAAHNLYRSIQQMVSWGHVKSLVFTKRALRPDVIRNVIDLLNRYNEIRHTIWVYATDTSLEKLFQSTPLLLASSYYSFLSNPEELFRQSSFIRPIRLNRFIAHIDEPAMTTRLPYLSLAKKEWTEDKKNKPMLVLKGACFLHNYKLQGCARISEVKGIRWVEQDIRRTPLALKKKGKTAATLIIREPHAEWAMKREGGADRIQLRVRAVGTIIEQNEPLSWPQLVRLSKEAIEQEIRGTYQWGAARGIDTLNISDVLYRNNLSEWRRLSVNGTVPLDDGILPSISVDLAISAGGKEKINYRAGD